MRYSLLFILCLAPFVSSAQAAEYKGVTYSVEPVVGYEFQRKTNPDRNKLVLSYGARVVAGYKILSGEGEYIQGKSDELFTSTGTQIEEKTEKFRVGLRSTYEVGSFLDCFLRAGAEAQKAHTKTTVAGVATETDSPYKIYPYAGTGLSLNFGPKFALNASVIATLKDINNLNKTEYSTTFGANINFSAK